VAVVPALTIMVVLSLSFNDRAEALAARELIG
jgi:hypothetical protein